jgi:O-antigen/teichoic acid export membrane protein
MQQARSLPASGAVARAVAVSTTAQVGARALDVLVNVAVSLLLIRSLGPTGYGEFVVVVTAAGLAGLLAELGLPKVAVREVAAGRLDLGVATGTVVAVRLMLSVAATGVVQVVLLGLSVSATVHLAALVASSMFVAEALLSVAIAFHVAVAQHHEALARLGANIVKLVLVVWLVQRDAGLVPIVAATTATLLVAAALAWPVARRRFGARPRIDRAAAAHLVREALPVAPAMLVGVVYLKIDALMVALFGVARDVGVYGAAYQPVEYLFLASAIVVQVLLPLVARATTGDHLALEQVYRRGTDLLLVLVAPVSLILVASARPLVHDVYEPRYAPAAAPMALLGLALVAMTVNVWQGTVLVAARHARANLVYLSAAVGLNIALDLVLVPRHGPVGAAWGTLLSATFLVAASTRAVTRHLHIGLRAEDLTRLAAAVAVAAGVLVAVRAAGGHWVVAAAAAGIAYIPALGVFGVVRHADLAAVLRSRAPLDDGARDLAAEVGP